MAAKSKKDTNDDGKVKIVGLNHGLCLAHTLFLEGWKHECYADVTFYCRPTPGQKQKNQSQPRKNLRANRSVLAAASPFFARLLPDCELESDVCVSTELTYDDMFCVLEYIYSGKLLCPTSSRNRLQDILKEFLIVVPEQQEETDIPEIEILVEEADPFPPVCSSTPSKGAIKIYSNKNRKSLPNTLQRRSETAPAKLATSANHSSNVTAKVSASNAAVRAPIKLLEVGSIFPRHSGTDPKLPKVVERETIDYGGCLKETVTLPPVVRNVEPSVSSPLHMEKGVIRDTATVSPASSQSRYPLHLYVLHTWGHGIHSNMERSVDTERTPVTEKPPTRSRGPSLIHNWTTSRQPTYLSSRPSKVYTKGGERKVGSRSRSPKDKYSAILRLDDIQNMRHHNGKIHVTLNGEPLLQQSVPQLFHGDTETPAASCSPSGRQTPVDHEGMPVGPEWNSEDPDAAPDSQQDKTDYVLAKHFVQEEVKRKQRLLMKMRMFNERLQQYKKVARDILAKKKEMEKKNLLDGSYKRPPAAKKPAAQVQCEQCGKMILASRLSIHLKTHGGVKSHLCELCGRAFLLKAYLNAHIRINHRGTNRPKRFMCSICGYTCDQKHKLEVHERIHTDERPFDCQYCDKKFREKGTLTRHIRTHTGEKPYECNICGTAYAARDTYVQHYKRKHAPRAADAPTETRPDRRRKDSNVVIYRCEFCQKGFFRVLAYEKHRAMHTGVAAAVPCSQSNCDFTYSDMTQLKDHMAICHPAKIYTCGTCSKVFLTKQNLVNHQAKHDPNLGFHCSHCSLSLTTKASLIAHEKIHTRERPYVCPYCSMSFHSPYLIKIHVRKHQPPQPGPKRKRNNGGKQGTNNSSNAMHTDEGAVVIEEEAQEHVDYY